MIKGVIFDLDGTLYDYELTLQYAQNTLFEYMLDNFDIKKEYAEKLLKEAKICIKNNLSNTASSHNRILYFQKICEMIGVNIFENSIKMYNIYWDIFLKEIKLYDFVLPLFNYLKENDIKIGILTDLTTMIQIRKINILGISHFVDYFVTSEEAGIDKPDKKMFEIMVSKMKLSKKNLIMIGDDEKKDIKGAEIFGIKAIKIDKNYTFNEIKDKLGLI